MSILDKISLTKPGAPRITLYGKPGVGKSTLASQFDNPLFVLTEDNELSNINALPVAQTFSELWNNVKDLLKLESLPFKTIVIDSISKMDTLVIEHVIKASPLTKNREFPETLAQAFGGYGAGFEKATSLHRAFKQMMDKFKERGITVIYISHVEIKKYKSPEQDDYDIISIVMNSDKSRAIYIDDVDLVGLCKIKSHVISTDSGRNMIKSTGEHVLSVGINEVHVSKNRYAMPDEIKMSFDELAKYIPFYNKGK